MQQSKQKARKDVDNEPLEPLLTIPQVMQILQVSRPTVYVYMGDGLPIIRLGRAVRFSPGSLKQWLAQREEIA